MKYKQWLLEWLDVYAKPNLKSRSYNKYKYMITHHIIRLYGEYELKDLTAAKLQKGIYVLSETYSSNTVNGIISLINMTCDRAYKDKLIPVKISGELIGPRVKERAVVCLSQAEQRKIERYVTSKPRSNLFGILLCLYTGLRVGELIALTWEDVDLKAGKIVISKSCHDSYVNGRYVKVVEEPKTATSLRVIPLPRQIMPFFRLIRASAKCEYVIATHGRGMSVRAYQATFTRMLKRLNIPLRGFHCLRHTFATRALECGMDVRTLSELLGHNNPAITLRRYAHSMLEHKTEMMNRLGKLYQ